MILVITIAGCPGWDENLPTRGTPDAPSSGSRSDKTRFIILQSTIRFTRPKLFKIDSSSKPCVSSRDRQFCLRGVILIMPEFGKKSTNARLTDSQAVARWRSLSLYGTQIDDDGIALLDGVANKLEEIHIESKLITDRSMPVLCRLPKLISLLLDGVPRVTDAGITCISEMTQLRELFLAGTQLTDAGIDSLLGLTNVWSLTLSDTKITDAGVAKLSKLNSLGLVMLNRTQIRGYGLWNFPQGADNLYLEGCPVTDEGIAGFLKTHDKTRILSLSGTQVTDAILPLLAQIESLEDLRLENTMVTDAGIQHLCGHKTLGRIYLAGTGVSEEMIVRLKRKSRSLIVYV
ncbi:MAG: leucine-rich repeat domain-containing protein [Planctomycetaceae bacterium]